MVAHFSAELIAADGSASTGRQSHSELGSTAAVALEERALAGGVKAHRVEIFPLDQRVNLPKCGHSVDVLNDGNQPIRKSDRRHEM